MGIPRRKTAAKGQVLAGVIVLLLILAIMVPLMVDFTINEAKWTNKQSRNTIAMHLAEAGTEKGVLAISIATITWVNLMNGTAPVDFRFDKKFTDVSGGDYAICVSSGPEEQQATIISVGRDNMNMEVRALKVIVANAPMGGTAIYGNGGVQVDGGVQVEWGAVVSPNIIQADSRTYPQFWSASGITTYDTAPAAPNCDSPNCCQWHAYASNIPSQPTIDLGFYKSSATNSTGCPAGGNPEGSCYYDTAQTWKGVTITGGKPIYMDSNLSMESPGVDITGTLVVMGNLLSNNGAWGMGVRDMTVPRTAWKQYCNDWAHYKTFDAAAAAAFPGVNSSYKSAANLTFSSKKISVDGLLYVNGSFLTGGGGGQADVYGTMLVVGSSTMTNNSAVVVYFNEQAGKSVQWTKVVLTRISWQDSLYTWPSGL